MFLVVCYTLIMTGRFKLQTDCKGSNPNWDEAFTITHPNGLASWEEEEDLPEEDKYGDE